MIVDTSAAILAVLFNEDDVKDYAQLITASDSRRMSAATFVETAIVVETKTKTNGGRQLDAFMQRAGIEIEAITEEHAHLTRQAFIDFGKGRHPVATGIENRSNIIGVGPLVYPVRKEN